MELKFTENLFSLNQDDVVTKKNLYDLIQFSKVKGSEYWAGDSNIINNTPQQGINWIGDLPDTKGVLIKTRPGSYVEDGWSDDSHNSYHYSFKARNNVISYTEKANQVLISQPQHLYPIFLFTESGSDWIFRGAFSVSTIEDTYVVLSRYLPNLIAEPTDEYNKNQHSEGSKKYVTHLMAERNSAIVKEVKQSREWVCDICNTIFKDTYGVKYIEAHHKIPISTYSSQHEVKVDDFTLLCPNCHKAVHIYMRKDGIEYDEIHNILKVKNA
ncbi:MAG: HNH endonuclease [Gammaproteobacteria bacterium]|nr:HNH endonuclease [Gammaproteobacteria bacterium]